jgi:hypothetical protein
MLESLSLLHRIGYIQTKLNRRPRKRTVKQNAKFVFWEDALPHVPLLCVNAVRPLTWFGMLHNWNRHATEN